MNKFYRIMVVIVSFLFVVAAIAAFHFGDVTKGSESNVFHLYGFVGLVIAVIIMSAYGRYND